MTSVYKCIEKVVLIMQNMADLIMWTAIFIKEKYKVYNTN
jgi:hypothetical protein